MLNWIIGLLLLLPAGEALAATPAELWEDAQRLHGRCLSPMLPSLCDGPPAVVTSELPHGYVGLYQYHINPRVVLIAPRTPNGPMRDSFIVHEYVHYLQWIRGRINPAVPCPDTVENEVEAYSVQSRWLVEKTGKPFPPDALGLILLEHRMACHAVVPHG